MARTLRWIANLNALTLARNVTVSSSSPFSLRGPQFLNICHGQKIAVHKHCPVLIKYQKLSLFLSATNYSDMQAVISSLVMNDHGNDVDLISDLPRNVIDSILGKLPIQDAVKTSILSRNWRYRWTTVPRLEFNATFFENIAIGGHLKKRDIPHVISQVLLQHSGSIHEFILCIPRVCLVRLKCLSLWILFLSRRNMKVLKLVNGQADPYEMPSHLFSCKDLIRLELINFTLRSPPDSVDFKSLVQLHMHYIRIESPTLESLISSCPMLENLTISHCVGFDYLNISSPNLKVLIIENFRCLKSICFEESASLTDLEIALIRSVKNVERGRMSDLVNIFSPLLEMKKLRLVNGYIQYLSAGSIPEKLPKMIYSLTHLQLSDIAFSEPQEISLLHCFLKSVPNLEELQVMIRDQQPILDRFLGFTSSACSFPRLQTVTIEAYTIFEMAMDFVEYLLAVSPSLKTLTFRIRQEKPDAIHLLEASRVLLRMERASPKAKVNFI